MPDADRVSSGAGLRSARYQAEPMVWLCGGALVIALGLLLALISLLAVRGFEQFWPQPLALIAAEERSGPAYLGRVLRQTAAEGVSSRALIYRGADDLFREPLAWIPKARFSQRQYPPAAIAIEREGAAPVFGFAEELRHRDSTTVLSGLAPSEQVGRLNQAIVDAAAALDAAGEEREGEADTATTVRIRLSSGEPHEFEAAKLRFAYAPNAMSVTSKLAFLFSSVQRFMSESPESSNTQGGVFPAIVGTVTLVLLMTIIVTPLGVLAAVYLQEYAQQGPVTRLVRIAVNNLAGVPSIVYGVFGLGFFVYAIGGSVDALMFSDQLPAPTLGTPGMLWAALTMALLTLPVVVVTTEEGLARVPHTLREGAFALGSTRAEALWQVIYRNHNFETLNDPHLRT